MANDPRDFPNEGKDYNKCHMCKAYFTGLKGRIYCRLCAPVTIEIDQVPLLNLVVDYTPQ